MVQAVADAFFKFLDVSTGFPGSIHDAPFSDLVNCIERSFKVTGLTGLRNKLGLAKLDLCWLGTQLIPYQPG